MLKEKLIEETKQFLKDNKITVYRLHCMTGIDKTPLMKFIEGKQNLTLKSADRLAHVLGIIDVIFVKQSDL